MILTGMESNTKVWGAKIETIIENIKLCIATEDYNLKPLTFLHI